MEHKAGLLLKNSYYSTYKMNPELVIYIADVKNIVVLYMSKLWIYQIWLLKEKKKDKLMIWIKIYLCTAVTTIYVYKSYL